jgi:hypothetical protein
MPAFYFAHRFSVIGGLSLGVKQTYDGGQEDWWLSIVRAHPLRKTQRMRHPQVHLFGDVRAGTQEHSQEWLCH